MKNDKLISPEDVTGYKELSQDNKKLFGGFLNNFYKAWEHPEKHIPVRVKTAKDFLRVDFKDGDWLHVIDQNSWY